MKYLQRLNDTCLLLDHRLLPEVRATLAAMASRLPTGGIEARYDELLEAAARELPTPVSTGSYLAPSKFDREQAEHLLSGYPVPEKVQAFIDKFVGDYGHSSVLELTGSPAVYAQGVSPWTAYQSFDSPLVSGQEFSTRAVRRKDWPICQEAKGVPELEDFHSRMLSVFSAEVSAWRKRKAADPDSWKTSDPQHFRFALDRARWALPSTISTGFCHTANIRTMGRVIRQGMDMNPGSLVWADIHNAYSQALPGLDGMWCKEALSHGTRTQLPMHLRLEEDPLVPKVASACVRISNVAASHIVQKYGELRLPKHYLDPLYNHAFTVHLGFRCSWAVARDWHRHRTGYPWRLGLCTEGGSFRLHDSYQSITGQDVPKLMQEAYALHKKFKDVGNMEKAMCCLPFGAETTMTASMGMRDAVYMLELRANTPGANFEYKRQAEEALRCLRKDILRSHDHIMFGE